MGVSGVPYRTELTRFPANDTFSSKCTEYGIFGELGLPDHGFSREPDMVQRVRGRMPMEGGLEGGEEGVQDGEMRVDWGL